jgi:glucose-6-phosphate isomerase
MIKNNLITNNFIQKKYLDKKIIDMMSKDFNGLINEINLDIENIHKTLHILSKNYKFNFNKKDLEQFQKFKTVVLIGMGGSILGAESIYSFLMKKIKKKFYFFNNLDSKKITKFKKKENLKKTLFLIISKSGDTVETLSNFFILSVIKKNAKNIIIISEKKNNTLFMLSQKFNLFHIEHNKNIGGRYSVLSEVGIIPAYLMGVNVTKLRLSIKKFLNTNKIFLKESAIKLASLLHSKKISNLIFINYSLELEKFLEWCQQLIAESLGKQGKGFLPMISHAPKDHHSLLQLYIDGPRNKLFHIFSVEENEKEKIDIKKISNKKNFLHNKTLNTIKLAQKNALIESLKKNKIPFREFKIKKINEEILGELFSYFILETVVIGKLIKVNPFNQPAVEEVKIYTKKLLT